jgi:uncharacterized protein
MTPDGAPTERTRLRRKHQRGHHDRATIDSVLDAAMVCHVGYVIDGSPYVTPTLHWREGDRLYWHGSSASRMLRAVVGSEVCVTVTHLDGLVLARSGFNHSANYRSVMAFGIAEAIEDPAVKRRALDGFVDRMFPGRSREIRPMTEQEMKATTVLSIPLDEVSAKIRTGPPLDDALDLELEVWAGVLPMRLVTDAPEPDPNRLRDVPLPPYLADR